jgi:hypothetical protein
MFSQETRDGPIMPVTPGHGNRGGVGQRWMAADKMRQKKSKIGANINAKPAAYRGLLTKN